ncbi:MAG: hypothetical protein J7513_04835 [Solirubrobacteraceae bacterium]|nr:hypothetical protein [Solirubrobacteraceae bacterium]
MNQVSRPMQIMLIGVLVFAALWMTVLKPKDEAAEPAAATPVATSPVAAGGDAASSAPGKAVEAANNAAATSNAATARDEAQTGEQTATTPAGAAPAATTPAGTTPAAGSAEAVAAAKAKVARAKAKAAKKAKSKAKAKAAENAAQKKADKVTELVAKDLKTRHAVVVLVASNKGTEDKVLRTRVKKDIDRRKGRVKVYIISASQVGVYDGLLGSLNIAQTPSTIVIAPNNQAKVLGGLVSTARIDRLTSAALLVKPDTKTTN